MTQPPETPLLDTVQFPADLRKLRPEQLRQLMRTDFDDRIRLGKFRRLPDGASALDVALLLGGIRSQHGRQPQPALVPDRR